MISLAKNLARVSKDKHLPELLALAGGIFYLGMAFYYAHRFQPNLDEAAYLFKGYQFATGVYEPFQPYGFWTNKMPLAFLIWGWVQNIFGQGLRVGRLFAFLLSGLTVLGVWIVARRLGSRWLAAAAVWVLALNPTVIALYSLAVSQILVIFMLAWILVLSVGEGRPGWQLVLGGLLTGVMIMTRQNMIFVLPLLLGYILWEHGWKAAALSCAAASLVLVIGHLLYWPEILKIWTDWIPFNISLPASVEPAMVAPVEELITAGEETAAAAGEEIAAAAVSGISLATRIHSLSVSLRIYVVPLVGSLIAVILWPKKDSWRDRAHFRTAVFLAALFAVLVGAHAWASLFKNYCVYCFQSYLAFFWIVGLLLVVASLREWNRRPSFVSVTAVTTVLLLITPAVFYSLFEQIGRSLINLPIPRLREGRILPGRATLWDLLANKFHIEDLPARMFTPPVVGFIVGLLLLLVLYLVFRRLRGRTRLPYATFAAYGFLCLGLIVPFLTAQQAELACETDVIGSYERIGSQLASVAVPGSRIYLDGRVAALPLLYAPDVTVLPPQLNGWFSYSTSQDSEWLLRNGLWNDAIARGWRDSADIFVIARNRYHDWNDEYLESDAFLMIPIPYEWYTCPADDHLFIFVRK